MEGAECRRGTGTVEVSVGCFMACSDWRVLSVGEEQEQYW